MATRKAVEEDRLTETQVVEIWNSMLDAEGNIAYWGKLIHKKQKADQWAKSFVAIVSSSTVASWNIWANMPVVWKTVSCVSAVISIIHSQLHLNRDVNDLTTIYVKWTKIHTEYHELIYHTAPKVAGTEAWNRYSKLLKEEDDLAERSIKFPKDERLHRKCCDEVERLHDAKVSPGTERKLLNA